ncbi:hypothetical protein C0Q70_10909 [Pomacea canaliculata]|uniref:Uncharacterized protein n=1 Tax=Pomacea canaliculata TaxID=400727 RepID=A0A2T7P4H4_POMCA|nr:hypothetical protein C0Q70_10909 [Pomacea canaliculata]
MSRNNVSVARFYDLSDDRQGTASASHIYREMAGPAGGPLSLSEIATKKADGVKMSMSKTTARVTPGRMFLRDKGMLTKGEREIIKGICKNRGDLRRDGCSQSDMTVRHHHEAWQMGKAMTASKDLLRGTLLEMASSGVAGGEAVSVKSLTQIKPKLVEKHPKLRLPTSRRDGGGLITPPSTPEPSSIHGASLSNNFQPHHHCQTLAPHHHTITPAPRLPHRRQETSSHETIVVTPLSAHTSQDTEPSDSDSQDSRGRRKIQVKVYLPKVGADTVDDDIKACILHGKPILARERHINQNDLKHKKLHKDSLETTQASTWERLPTTKYRDKPRVVTLTNRPFRGATEGTGTGRFLPA